MKYFISLVLAIGVSSPVLADIEDPCADLWFSRNAMLDKAGYCFSTPLGKALFDNSDCTTKQPKLTPEVKAQIAVIRKLEQGDEGGFYETCNIDTGQQKLDLPDLEVRKQLDFQPASDGDTSFCLGYVGPDIPLYAAPWKSARRTGVIRGGDNLSLAHLDWKGWSFSIVFQPSETTGLGWYQSPIADIDQCEAWAG